MQQDFILMTVVKKWKLCLLGESILEEPIHTCFVHHLFQ